jgi:hypothetical protein
LTSDGQKLSCTTTNTAADKDEDMIAALDQLDITSRDLLTQLMPMESTRVYVGSTAIAHDGAFRSNPPVAAGLAASAAFCAAEFGVGARMCTMDDLYQSVVNGTLGATSAIKPSWVYMPNWNTPLSDTVAPYRGMADNCAGYNYHNGANHWRGILVEWGPLPDGTPGFRWHGGDDAACYTSHPVACCK